MRTNVYVDGFNLYYNALKYTAYKWLDIRKYCELAFPANEITFIKYYTARPLPIPTNLGVASRHDVYMRALKTLPDFFIKYGNFQRKDRYMPRSEFPHNAVEVIRTEEKGSDVNLAVNLVNDAYKNRYDVAIVVSNDSDLCEAVRIVKTDCDKVVGHLSPTEQPGQLMKSYSTFTSSISNRLLARSQFPDHFKEDGGRVIRKPEEWDQPYNT